MRCQLLDHNEVSELLLSFMTPEFGNQWRNANADRRRELSGLPPIGGSVQPIHSQPEPSSPPTTSSDAKSRPLSLSLKKSDILGGLRKFQAPGFLPGLGNSEKHGEIGSKDSQGHDSGSAFTDAPATATTTPAQVAIDDVMFSDRAVDDVLYFNNVEESDGLYSDVAVEDVLYSNVGISTLNVRLKQSITSARQFASFCAARSRVEDERAKTMRRICKTTEDETRKAIGRQGSYAEGMQDILQAYEEMAAHDTQLSVNLYQIHNEVIKMAEYTDGERRRIKSSGLAAEQRVQDAERQTEKAKARYESLAQDYMHAKRSRNISSRRFTLRGPKSAEQFEEDLYRKVTVADEEYHAKVANLQQLRDELVSTLRPGVVDFLKALVEDIDACLKMQMLELAIQQENLLSKDDTVIFPTKRDGTKTSLRNKIEQIDNDTDFRSYILGFSSEVLPHVGEIKYEQHPALLRRPTS